MRLSAVVSHWIWARYGYPSPLPLGQMNNDASSGPSATAEGKPCGPVLRGAAIVSESGAPSGGLCIPNAISLPTFLRGEERLCELLSTLIITINKVAGLLTQEDPPLSPREALLFILL